MGTEVLGAQAVLKLIVQGEYLSIFTKLSSIVFCTQDKA